MCSPAWTTEDTGETPMEEDCFRCGKPTTQKATIPDAMSGTSEVPCCITCKQRGTQKIDSVRERTSTRDNKPV
jgi:hypothetical protein